MVHTETQDGKTILDLHFGVSTKQINTFMKTWRTNRITKIQTPKGLALALSYNKGMRNCIVQLVEFDVSVLNTIKDVLEDMKDLANTYFSRANNIYYYEPTDVIDVALEYDLEKILCSLKFRIGAQAYSGVDDIVHFNVDFEAASFIPSNPSSTQNDISNDLVVEI